MTAQGWPQIDWSRPWFAPYRDAGVPAYEDVRRGLPVAQVLNAILPRPPIVLRAGRLRFVPQQELPPGMAYEAHIAATACVPTRDNLHDFFNGLVWLAFPAWKRRLNELQAEQIAAQGIGGRRGAVRDALTLFDENGALLRAPADVIEDLRERRWQRLFVERRGRWQAEARCVVFGHALLEKLVAPWKSVTAHVWVDKAPPAHVLDHAGPSGQRPFAAGHERLAPDRLASKPFLPLPVLGVPGWWAANEDPHFYDDPQVFRPLPCTHGPDAR